jgi:hypothetical protein
VRLYWTEQLKPKTGFGRKREMSTNFGQMATFDFLRPWGQGSILKKLGEIALLPVFD